MPKLIRELQYLYNKTLREYTTRISVCIILNYAIVIQLPNYYATQRKRVHCVILHNVHMYINYFNFIM